MKKPRICVVFTYLRGFCYGGKTGIRTMYKHRIYDMFDNFDYFLTTNRCFLDTRTIYLLKVLVSFR